MADASRVDRWRILAPWIAESSPSPLVLATWVHVSYRLYRVRRVLQEHPRVEPCAVAQRLALRRRLAAGATTRLLSAVFFTSMAGCVHGLGDWTRRVDPVRVGLVGAAPPAAVDGVDIEHDPRSSGFASVATTNIERESSSVTIIAWSRDASDQATAADSNALPRPRTQQRLSQIWSRIAALRAAGETVVSIELPTQVQLPDEPRGGRRARERARARECRKRDSSTAVTPLAPASDLDGSAQLNMDLDLAADIRLSAPWRDACDGAVPPPDLDSAALYVVTQAQGLRRVTTTQKNAPRNAAQGGLSLHAEVDGEILVEIVVIDLRAWLATPVRGEPERTGRLFSDRRPRPLRQPTSTLESSRAQQISLLRSLTPRSPDANRSSRGMPPRILVLAAPVESAVSSGQGGAAPIGTFRQLPDDLQAALVAGAFDGVIAGHDTAASAVADLRDAIARSAREWCTFSLFQLTTGSIERGATVAERQGWLEGIALTPDVLAMTPSFVEARLLDGTVGLSLWSLRAGRWRVATVGPSTISAPHNLEESAPGQVPCRRCVPTLGAAEGWVAQPQ